MEDKNELLGLQSDNKLIIIILNSYEIVTYCNVILFSLRLVEMDNSYTMFIGINYLGSHLLC